MAKEQSVGYVWYLLGSMYPNKWCCPLLEGRKITFCVGKNDKTVGIQPQSQDARHGDETPSQIPIKSDWSGSRRDREQQGIEEARRVAPRAS